jgi:CelD/BcsL family acetyltransferase involved in cellulose biosynthesis
MTGDNPAALQVAAVADPAGFDALKPEWRQLADACPYATVFQTYEWNAAWWRHFGRGRLPHIVTLRDAAGGLVGLAPLMTSYWYAGPLRRLAFIGTGGSDYLDILARPGQEARVAEALYVHLAGWNGWHVADLQQLREDSLCRQYPPANLFCYDAVQEPCPYLPIETDWVSVLNALGKKTRYNIGYYSRSLEKLHEVEFGWANAEDLDSELDCLFELHQRRWNKRWLPGVFGTKRVQAFHRDVARALLERDWLRLYYLRLDGSTEASLYCFSYGDRACYYQGGFEPSLAKLSLGTVLTARAIQTAADDGKRVFDFLRGDEPYKAKWTGLSRRNVRRLMARSRILAPLVHLVQTIEDAVETRTKQLAQRMR